MDNLLSHGCLESTPSHNDLLSQNVMGGAPVESFTASYTVPHDNQRGDGICTMAHIADVLYQMYGVEVSEQFGYVGGKLTYDKNMIEGSSIKTMLEFARVYGLPKKTLVPTDSTFKNYTDYTNVTFTAEAWNDANNQKLPGYYKITDLSLANLIQEGAKSKYGLSIMIRTGNNWYTDVNGNITWDNSRIAPLRKANPITGAHATKISYLNISKDGKIRNTWGDKSNPIYANGTGVWADNGDISFNWDTISGDIVEAWGILDKPVVEVFTHIFNTNLYFGSTGAEVSNLQRALKKLSYYSYSITGNFGPITQTALAKFQKDNGIVDDGTHFGPQTRQTMNGKLNV